MNRDESFLRDTAPLQYWPEFEIFCGRDLVKGGTWLAVNKKGMIRGDYYKTHLNYYIYLGWLVAITNIKEFQPSCSTATASRGGIPLKLLSQSSFDPLEWKNIIENHSNCTKFNVIFGDLSVEPENTKIYAFSSETRELIECTSSDKSKIFSLANGDDICGQKWFKQQRGEELILKCIDTLSEDSLFKILT